VQIANTNTSYAVILRSAATKNPAVLAKTEILRALWALRMTLTGTWFILIIRQITGKT
jgi:hypothetical protein